MNIYLIERKKEEFSWDTYISAVVVAETESDASTIHPDKDVKTLKGGSGWVRRPNLVKATLLGKAENTVKRGVILARYIS